METLNIEEVLKVKHIIDSQQHMLSRILEIKSRINTIKKYYEEYLELEDELKQLLLTLKSQHIIT